MNRVISSSHATDANVFPSSPEGSPTTLSFLDKSLAASSSSEGPPPLKSYQISSSIALKTAAKTLFFLALITQAGAAASSPNITTPSIPQIDSSSSPRMLLSYFLETTPINDMNPSLTDLLARRECMKETMIQSLLTRHAVIQRPFLWNYRDESTCNLHSEPYCGIQSHLEVLGITPASCFELSAAFNKTSSQCANDLLPCRIPEKGYSTLQTLVVGIMGIPGVILLLPVFFIFCCEVFWKIRRNLGPILSSSLENVHHIPRINQNK